MFGTCQWHTVCYQIAEFYCGSWRTDPYSLSGFSPNGRHLCEEHAGRFVRDNLPSWRRRLARPAVKGIADGHRGTAEKAGST